MAKINAADLAEALAELLDSKQQAQKAIANTRTGFGHGPGLFTAPMMPDIFNALQLPAPGLADMLPELPTEFETPLYGIITGQTVGGGGIPAGPCEPWGYAGLTKLCRQYAILGEQGVSTEPTSILRMGLATDRSDFRDYRLVGDPFVNTSNMMLDNLTGLANVGTNPNDFLNNELAKMMRETAVEEDRIFARDFWTSNPANVPDKNHRQWFRGLELQVNNGHQDAITGSLCQKADSRLTNFNNANISTSGQAASDMVEIVTDEVYVIRRMASEMGMDPVKFVFVGSPELFREMVKIWPCSYLTNRCKTNGNGSLFVDAAEQSRMQEDMFKGKYLLIDGEEIPFVVDSTVSQTQPVGGIFSSSLWLLPIFVKNDIPALFKTFFDFNKPGAAADVIRALGKAAYGMTVSPNGKYVFNFEKTFNCFQVSVTDRPGVILRAPYLAERFTNIRFQPRAVTPSWDPTAPSFYVNGGVTSGTGPSYYAPTTNG